VVRERLPSTQKMSMVCTLGGVARGSGVPPIHAKNVDGRRGRRSGSTRHQHKKYRWRAPGRWCQRSRSTHHQYKKRRGAPLGGGARGSGVLTINAKKHRRQAPWEAVPEVRERPSSMQKTLTAGPLGGGVGGLVAAAINAKNIDGGSRGRRCQRSVSAHQATQRRRWRAPWEAVSEVSELPPLISEASMVGPWAPLGVQTLSVVQACVVTCIGSIDKSSSADGSHSPCA
jgi:hypothetical protein